MPVSAAMATVAINGSASVRASEIRRTVVSRGDTRSQVTPIGSKGPAEVGVAEVMASSLHSRGAARRGRSTTLVVVRRGHLAPPLRDQPDHREGPVSYTHLRAHETRDDL